MTKGDLLIGLSKLGHHSELIAEVMQREFQIVDAQEMLETALLRLQNCACHTLPVEYKGKLVGLLTMENVGEFILVQSTRDERQKQLNSVTI